MRIKAPIWGMASVLVLASAFLTNHYQVYGQEPKEAEQEAKWWVDAFNANFNRHDAKGAAASYTPDADQRISTGEFLRGRVGIEKYLAALFERHPKAEQKLSLTSARFSGTDLLLAEAAWEITGLAQERRAKGVATYFLRKQGESWLCIAGRSMVPTQPPEAKK